MIGVLNLLAFFFYLYVIVFVQISPAGNGSPVVEDREAVSTRHKKGEVADVLEKEEGESPKENGDRRSNGIEEVKSDRSAERQPDVVDDHPGKSRSTFHPPHTSVILYANRFFQIRYFIKS